MNAQATENPTHTGTEGTDVAFTFVQALAAEGDHDRVPGHGGDIELKTDHLEAVGLPGPASSAQPASAVRTVMASRRRRWTGWRLIGGSGRSDVPHHAPTV